MSKIQTSFPSPTNFTLLAKIPASFEAILSSSWYARPVTYCFTYSVQFFGIVLHGFKLLASTLNLQLSHLNLISPSTSFNWFSPLSGASRTSGFKRRWESKASWAKAREIRQKKQKNRRKVILRGTGTDQANKYTKISEIRNGIWDLEGNILEIHEEGYSSLIGRNGIPELNMSNLSSSPSRWIDEEEERDGWRELALRIKRRRWWIYLNSEMEIGISV